MEAVKTNVIGSNNVITACTECKIKKAIFLSTDKAAYPVVYLLNFEDRKAEPPILEEAAHLRAQALELGLCLTEGPPRYALNYSNGDPVHFRAWRFDWGGCPGADQPSSSTSQ